MSQNPITVFVSSTSRDLQSFREAASSVLRTCDIGAVEQKHFGADSQKIRDMLREKIEPCDAVICLIGFYFGQAPGDEPHRSLPRGIAVYPNGENYPRLPLLGLRAILSNNLHLAIDGEGKSVNLRTPDWKSRLLRRPA